MLQLTPDADLLASLWANAASPLGSGEGLGTPESALTWRDEVALTVVLASKGYPGKYQNGSAIGGLEAAEADGAKVTRADYT